MKKLVIVLSLLILPALSCFAGSFYSNIVVFSVEKEQFLSTLIPMGLSAYYIFKDKTGVLFEKNIDDQGLEYGVNLSKELSKKLNATTVYATNYDSDILAIFIFKNGRLLFSYDSDPGYFDGEEVPPEIQNIDSLLGEYKSVKKNELLNILTSKEVFADDLHTKIVEILKLPIYSVGLGYNIIEIDDSFKEVIENEYKVKLEKI